MNDVIEHEGAEVVETQEAQPLTPMELIEKAVQSGADPEYLTKLMDLQDRYEDRQAKRAYQDAMNAFKAAPLDLFKDKFVSYENKNNTKTEYSHVTLEHASKVIGEALLKYDLSHRWETSFNEAIEVSCIITHVLGHSEKSTLRAPADGSGGKNNVQAIGSTVTYLQRYTLLAITGVVVKGMDDDALQLNEITQDEYDELVDLMADANVSAQEFCKAFEIEAVKNLRARNMRQARMRLKQKIKNNKE